AGLAADLVAADRTAAPAATDLPEALPPSAAARVFAAPRFELPAFVASPGSASGQRPLRSRAAVRAEAARAAGRRRSGGVAGPSAFSLRTAAIATVTSSTGAMPSTVLSTPLPA